MRLIPVIDLLDGRAVHAIKGDRAQYRPVRSVLCDTPDPLALARAFRDRLGLNEIYVADLNAIQRSGTSIHQDVIAAMTHREGMNVILDAGISDVENARAWLDCGARKVIVGSETLRVWDAVQNFPSKIAPDQLIFSLDFQSEKILSQCPALTAMTPIEILRQLQLAGWHEVILLDLKRVGSRLGADYTLAADARASFPDLQLFIGGGIARPEELIELKYIGIAGVLVATALHEGVLDVSCISSLGAK